MLGKVSALLCAALLNFSTLPAFAQQFDESDREEVIEQVARLLEERYVSAQTGARLAAQLRSEPEQFGPISQPEDFTANVTQWLREQSGDGHLGLDYSAQPLPQEGGDEVFSEAEIQRWYGPQLNHGFQRIERFDDNIMLLDMQVFPPSDLAGDMMLAAMTLVAEADALIIDLRGNGGGAGTAGIMLSYLAEAGAPLSGTYDRPTDTHTYSYVDEWMPGRRFGSEKPLYILTARQTFSAAEAVAYDLQALGRATIVGEVTGGGAHPFAYRRVHEHFAMDLPEGRSINPITGENWQDVGVQPDITVPAQHALEEALKLARAAISED